MSAEGKGPGRNAEFEERVTFCFDCRRKAGIQSLKKRCFEFCLEEGTAAMGRMQSLKQGQQSVQSGEGKAAMQSLKKVNVDFCLQKEEML